MDHTPLYIKIKEYILENIKSGNLKLGDKVPSEKELSELFNVSRITVSTAIRDLVNDGVVYRVQGKGTFIASNKEENIQNHSTFGFDDGQNSLINQGKHITKDISEIKADKKLSIKLGVNIDDTIFKIVRTKVVDNLVYAVEYIYLPAKLYPSFSLDNVKTGLIFDLVNEYCFLKQNRAKVYITPIIISDYDAILLGIPKKSPVLIWEKSTYSNENKVIEYSENIINTNIQIFYLEFYH